MSSGNLARFNGSIEKDKDSVYYSTHVKLTPATEQDEMEITSNAMKKNGCYYPNEKQSIEPGKVPRGHPHMAVRR